MTTQTLSPNRIRQLPASVITKIAAGEVIERPASALKELLENSVDAGATRIDVELEKGGTERILVVDDGCGIPRDQLPLAFASHATSKLRDADDLFRVGTLGFRGEALASIGGVAQVAIQTRTADAEGAAIDCCGGKLFPARPWGGPPGTRVEVRHLFFNTPVRKKFLRAPATELGHSCEAVTRLALSHPSLHVTLRHNGKLVHEVPAAATLRDRVGLFFGADVRDGLLDVDLGDENARLTGFAADPKCDRGNAKLQYVFLNGRFIRDRSVAHAIQEAYRGLLMVGRFAIVFLFLETPADAVDVNVHPAKTEVRFRDSQVIYHLVRSAVRRTLTGGALVPNLQSADADLPKDATFQPPPREDDVSEPVTWTPSMPSPAAPPAALPSPNGSLFGDTPAAARAMQIHNSFLVIETPDGVQLVDQHALHERILFEQVRRRVRDGKLERQQLLIPETIDLPAEQAARVLEAKDALAELGIEVGDFGGGTVVMSSYPALLGKASPGGVFRGVIDVLVGQDRPPTREQLFNDLLATVACKAAVKAGDKLNADEIATLMRDRDLAEDSHHCPHGRPTTLNFSRSELEKQFGRI